MKQSQKKWYTSRMLWFNVLTVAIQTYGLFDATFPIDPTITVLVMGMGNILLRSITKDELTV